LIEVLIHLASFSLDDYQRLASREQLGEWLNAAKDMDNIEFNTTRVGTVVTLNGEHKY
jgi:hypothetical protein